MFRSRPHHRRPALAAVATTAFVLALSTASVAAHKHVVNQGTDQETTIANGANHPQFILDTESGLFLSCTLEGYAIPTDFGEAWYGIETAHHGPDSGDAGKDDACYGADASPGGEEDDVNPAID